MKLFCITDQIKLQKKKYVEDYKLVLNSEKFILNKNVFKIENTLKNFVGSKYCISTSSGTDALLISLMAYGISGDSHYISYLIEQFFDWVAGILDIKGFGLIDEGKLKKLQKKKFIPVHLG